MLVSDPGAGLRPPPPIPYGLGGGADTMHAVEYQHGTVEAGPQANKKRQRVDGRSYTIKVNRPSIIAHYNNKWNGWIAIIDSARIFLGIMYLK